MKNPTISVVIPAYNEEESIGLCLTSLVNQNTKRSFEVIIVNNNSTDNTANIVRIFKDRLNLRLISEKKKGRGAARARGFEEAKGNIIFTTDADTIIPQDWIESFVKCFRSKNVVAVTGTCKINDNSWIENEIFNFFQPWTMVIYRIIMQNYWLSGFSFAIRKEIYQKAGKIDTKLNALDDFDLTFRVMKYGKIQIVKNPVITSGRRFRGNFIGGVTSYMKPMLQIALNKKKTIFMDDVRA